MPFASIGDAVGRVFFHGLGAGQMPTASAVVSDIIDTILGRMAITFKTSEPLVRRAARPLVKPRNPADVLGRFYLRFNVDDRPGVMADIAGILGKHQISIASLIQHENEEEAQQRAVGHHDPFRPGRRDAKRPASHQRPFQRSSRHRADESSELD